MDKTTDNVWVPDAYIQTGYSGFATGVPQCNDNSGDIHNFPATSNLDGRTHQAYRPLCLRLISTSAVVKCQSFARLPEGLPTALQSGTRPWTESGYRMFMCRPGTVVLLLVCRLYHDECSYQVQLCRQNQSERTEYHLSIGTSSQGLRVWKIITVTCQSIGENAYGSNIWDKTTDELWVTDYYVKTGFDTFVPGLPRCTDNITGSNSGYPTETDLDGRNTKLISAAAVKVYPSGSTINIACQAYGEWAYGSYIWDKTSDGLWVTDFYVKTGTSGSISNMPRCDNDPPTGGPTSGGSSTCDTAGHGRNSGPAGSTAGTSAEKIQRVLDLA